MKTSSATSFHNLASLDHDKDKDKDKDRYLKETGALWVVYILTSRSGKESAVEFFLDELAEVEPAKVAPELLSINSDDDDSDDYDYKVMIMMIRMTKMILIRVIDMNKTKIFSFT